MSCFIEQKILIITQELHHNSVKVGTFLGSRGHTLKVLFPLGVKNANFS